MRGLLGQLIVTGWARIRQASLGVEKFFLGLSGFSFVAPLRSIVGELSAVMLPAAKRAAQISTPLVPRVGQKEYPAMLASRQASSKVWLVLDDRPQTEAILQYKLPNPIIVIPSFAKFKTLTDFYGKFARFSLIILIVFCISSSYPIEATGSTGGAGIFFLLGASVSCNWQDLPEVWIVRAQ